MKKAVKNIETALKSLYQIDLPYTATDFLVKRPLIPEKKELQGTLYIVPEGEDLNLGIYFHPTVREELSEYPQWDSTAWTNKQRNAFATAAEEISHFLYLLFHSTKGRSISQFELELQGEIDKFLLLYFSGRGEKSDRFEILFETLFANYDLARNLSDEERARYEDASRFAKRFVLHLREKLVSKNDYGDALRILRSYYRLSQSERVSFVKP